VLLPGFAFFAGVSATVFGVAVFGVAVFGVADFGDAAFGAVSTSFFAPEITSVETTGVVAPAPPDSPFAASLSVATALSRALVAVVIAASASVSVLAEVPARSAATFSRTVADVTRVAAAETVRGVTADGPLAAVLLAVARPLVVLVVLVLRVLVAGLAVALVAGLLASPVVPVVPVVPGLVAAVFVGTDLHPHLAQLRG